MIGLLGPAGVDPFDEADYREVLTRHTATPADVAVELGCTQERAARSMDHLLERGPIARRSGRYRRYAAVDPHVAA